MATYIVAAEAEEDLFDIWRYIARDNADSADRFVNSIIQRFNLLADNPRIGRSRPELSAGLRSLPFRNYVILYQATDYGVEIVRVLHGSRDVEGIFNQ